MEFQIRTDLAMEAHEILRDNREKGVLNDNIDQSGIELEEAGDEEIKITRVKVTNKQAENLIGKPIGNYVTLEIPGIKEHDQQLFEKTCKELAKEISSLVKVNDEDTVLIIGLGNWNVTPDALGPRAVSKLMVTRHLLKYVPDEIEDGVRPVCTISPGVLGTTGMETLEIVKGIVENIKPAVIIAIDALASRRMDRISTTMQIADTGISPGSGVGNKRAELSLYTLGIPVIAIGVPTVVDAATMANDTIDMVIDNVIKSSNEGTQFYEMLKNMDKEVKHQMIREVLNPYIGNLIVTPKEIDDIIDRMAYIIANGINIALHKGITLSDVNRYVN